MGCNGIKWGKLDHMLLIYMTHACDQQDDSDVSENYDALMGYEWEFHHQQYTVSQSRHFTGCINNHIRYAEYTWWFTPINRS